MPLDRFFNEDEVNGKQPIFGEVFSPEDVAQIAEGANIPCVEVTKTSQVFHHLLHQT